MPNQFSFICSPKHYKIISFFVERVLEKYDQMYEKVTLYDFSKFSFICSPKNYKVISFLVVLTI